ncbi:DNA-3-methyladenine glycosylase I [Acinetobacter boissieri]|uniref:DNA-3-methyladenine glycosylase I n=1 Tax=Acinetobacter boissieri TaxID=1219383 RepID=A0A1G6GM74_9GAMM|nr:DNA-3-methyladenine glycosylase I [Acinetobacter boissieri]SDB83044.1 DNA-3-methyladenine glycosylase I [Acinetobacter boissieri]
MTDKTRCAWCTADPFYMHYHDVEWGKPIHDEHALFEQLCLEGQQAGLSWFTVLKKRACYRAHFFQYPIAHIATLSDQEILQKCTDVGLIRHLGKLKAIRDNAIAWQQLKRTEANVSAWLWSFVDHQTQYINQPISVSEHSHKMSKALKKQGFKFVGPTICYAFMQATGMVSSHDQHCWLAQQSLDK